MPATRIQFEQAVYGSFPFWDKGYAVLAHSPGVRAEWLAAFQTVCQRYGEPPRGAKASGAFFSLRLPGGPWVVAGVSLQDADDRGRPGALAFHGLFLTPREFRKAGFHPFALTKALRTDWGPSTTLPSATISVDPDVSPIANAPEAGHIAAALRAGRRVAIESPEPLDDLARAAWTRLPERVRRRASLATLAFSNANRFDLAGFPRLAAVTLDSSYVEPGSLEHPPQSLLVLGTSKIDALRLPPLIRRCVRISMALLALFVPAAALLLFFRVRPADRPERPRPSATAAPTRKNYEELPTDAAERPGVVAALIDLASRCGLDEAGFDPNTDPADVMLRLSERLRYRGPLLSADQRTLLRSEGPEGSRALAWDDRIRNFLPDRPLPGDFARGPLRWQLDTFAWSFHAPLDPRLATREIPDALAEVLLPQSPLRPGRLAIQYPPLADYAHFLDPVSR
jgi:hypothetical protein